MRSAVHGNRYDSIEIEPGDDKTSKALVVVFVATFSTKMMFSSAPRGQP